MEKLRDIRVRYTHPAIPPIGIKPNGVYDVGYLVNTYKLDETIKVMFTPVDTAWEELEGRNNKKNKEKKNVAENLEITNDGTE